MTEKLKNRYSKQKLTLYFDENFPGEIMDDFKKDTKWNKQCRVTSVFDEKARGEDDSVQFSYCKKRGFTLVTLDGGFWDDAKFLFSRIPGIIIVNAGKNELGKIKQSLNNLLSFLSYFPFPRYFVGDSKFKVSSDVCVMKGRDAKTRDIKTYTITAGDTVGDVGKKFGWF